MNALRSPLRIGALYSSLRIVAMASRFALLAVFAKTAPDDVLAGFGALSGYLAVSGYFASADMYIPTLRASRRPRAFSVRLSNQLAVTAVGILLATMLMPVALGRIAVSSSWLIVALLPLDVATSELSRFAFGAGATASGHLIQFGRLGAWPALSMLPLLVGAPITLDGVLLTWIGTLSCVLAASAIFFRRSIRRFRFTPSRRVLWHTSLRQPLILASSTGLLLFSGIDRILIHRLAEATVAAPYTFYSSIFGAVNTLIYAGLVNSFLPHFLSPSTSSVEQESIIEHFGRSVRTLSTAFIAIAILALTVPFSPLTGQGWALGTPILLSCAVTSWMLSLSLPAHYALLGMRRDREIAQASLEAAIAFVLTALGCWLGGKPEFSPAAPLVAAGLLFWRKASVVRRYHTGRDNAGA